MQGASRPSRAASVEAVAPGAPAFSDTFTSQPEPDGDDDPLADERYAVVSLLSQRKALDAEFAEEVREVTNAAGSAALSTRTADERVRQRTLHKLHPRLASIAQRDTSLDEAITLRTEAQVRKLQVCQAPSVGVAGDVHPALCRTSGPRDRAGHGAADTA